MSGHMADSAAVIRVTRAPGVWRDRDFGSMAKQLAAELERLHPGPEVTGAVHCDLPKALLGNEQLWFDGLHEHA